MNLLFRLFIFPFVVFRQLLWPPIRKMLIGILIFIRKSMMNNVIFFLLAAFGLWYLVDDWLFQAAPPPPGLSATESGGKTPVALPEFKGVIENGNDPFAQNLLQVMDETTRALHTQAFHYAMTYAQADAPYEWANPLLTSYGRITVEPAFKAKSGVYCRKFKELIVYQNRGQSFHGKGCQRHDGQGWCRLKVNSANDCGIGYTPGIWGSFLRDSGRKYRSFMSWF